MDDNKIINLIYFSFIFLFIIILMLRRRSIYRRTINRPLILTNQLADQLTNQLALLFYNNNYRTPPLTPNSSLNNRSGNLNETNIKKLLDNIPEETEESRKKKLEKLERTLKRQRLANAALRRHEKASGKNR